MLFEAFEFVLELYKNFSFKTKWSATVYPAAGAIYVMHKKFYHKNYHIVHIERIRK